LFAQSILQSYQGSRDCPELNGRRDIEDVIAGHRAVGLFDASLWFVLEQAGQVQGVLLLNPTCDGVGVELVYLGLAPAARGRGLGDVLMRLALSRAGLRQFSHLSLAVDSQNTPALGLYYRHGMKRVGSRIAMIRELQTDH
jgi:ribosomal protein S18 acetylase RimI-like enzyme